MSRRPPRKRPTRTFLVIPHHQGSANQQPWPRPSNVRAQLLSDINPNRSSQNLRRVHCSRRQRLAVISPPWPPNLTAAILLHLHICSIQSIFSGPGSTFTPPQGCDWSSRPQRLAALGLYKLPAAAVVVPFVWVRLWVDFPTHISDRRIFPGSRVSMGPPPVRRHPL